MLDCQGEIRRLQSPPKGREGVKEFVEGTGQIR